MVDKTIKDSLFPEALRILSEDWGPSYYIPQIISPAVLSLCRDFHGSMNGAWAFVIGYIKNSPWCIVAGAFYLLLQAHKNINNSQKSRIEYLEKLTAKGNFKIWLEEVMDTGDHDYFFRGHIFNIGDSVENVLVRLVGLSGTIPPGTKDMNLQWSGGLRGPRDIDNEHDAVFDIARTPRHTPKPLRFFGWEGNGLNSLYADVEPGRYSFHLHITGHKLQKIKVQCEIEFSHTQEKSVAVIKPEIGP